MSLRLFAWHRILRWWLMLALAGCGCAQAASYTFRSDTFSWESTVNTISWARLCTGYPGDDDQATINFTGWSGNLSLAMAGAVAVSTPNAQSKLPKMCRVFMLCDSKVEDETVMPKHRYHRAPKQ